MQQRKEERQAAADALDRDSFAERGRGPAPVFTKECAAPLGPGFSCRACSMDCRLLARLDWPARPAWRSWQQSARSCRRLHEEKRELDDDRLAVCKLDPGSVPVRTTQQPTAAD